MSAVPVHAHSAPLIDIVCESELWNAQPDAETAVRRAIMEAQREISGEPAEMAIMLTDDVAIRALNRTWRQRDEPTNVLSFPASAGAAHPGQARHLGDIAIAFETLSREAAAQSKPFADHLAHLAVHGYLHLMGYDHEHDADADTMERLETAILARLGVPDPYARSNHS